MKKGIRHGDMALIWIDKLPEGLTKSDSKVLMTGSGGNDHTYINGEFYPKQVDQFVFGYFKALDNCKLYHKEHGEKDKDRKFLTEVIDSQELKVTIIPAGKIAVLKKQNEDTHTGMKPVVD